MKPFATILFMLCLALAGCVRTPLETEEYSPILMISQSGDGRVQLVWESEPDYYYTIFYRDGSNSWQELRAVRKERGTGASMSATDQTDPNKPPRRYRLFFEKAGR